jgi:hypothetical protein
LAPTQKVGAYECFKTLARARRVGTNFSVGANFSLGAKIRSKNCPLATKTKTKQMHR